MTSSVASEEPSLTTMSSRSRSVWLNTDSMLSCSNDARLNVGRTTETSGGLHVDDCSICPEPSNGCSTCAESTSQVSKAILFRVDHGSRSKHLLLHRRPQRPSQL